MAGVVVGFEVVFLADCVFGGSYADGLAVGAAYAVGLRGAGHHYELEVGLVGGGLGVKGEEEAVGGLLPGGLVTHEPEVEEGVVGGAVAGVSGGVWDAQDGLSDACVVYSRGGVVRLVVDTDYREFVIMKKDS